MRYWIFDGVACEPITARVADRDHRDTDAGTDDAFVVCAATQAEAQAGALEWLRARADDDDDMMPDGLHLDERLLGRDGVGGSYIVLQVE